MYRQSIGATVALALALAGAVLAQETKTVTKTTTKSEKGKPVKYSGCLQADGETESYMLNKVVPLSKRTVIGLDGSAETTTTYKETTTTFTLVPGEAMDLRRMIGREVEVTGMMIPAGERRTETKTKIERDGEPDVTSTVKSKTTGASPEFRVTSIRQLADSCS